MPLFDVIIPTHNRPILLIRALRSLINQSWQDFNVIIIDDSGQFIPPYAEFKDLSNRFTYVIRSGVSGPAESRNLGIKISKGDYVIFLDDDDIIESNHLSILAEYVNKKSPELVSCDFQVRFEDRSTMPPIIQSNQMFSISGMPQDNLYVRNHIPNSCIAYRKDVVSDKTYNSDMIIYEDWDFLLSCIKNRTIEHVPINSIVIHKTASVDGANARRGNTRNDLVLETTLELYKKYPAPNQWVDSQRKNLFNSLGLQPNW